VDDLNSITLSSLKESYLHISSVKNSLQNFTLTDQILEEKAEDTNIAETDEHMLNLMQSSSDSEINSGKNVEEESYCWRIDLSQTEPYWTGWFQGLSCLFLSSPVQAKLLLLAGIDRLDKALTIGQMQGALFV
jgi:protein phosphatase methylesterase 1 (EC 3.1.1.-) (PME-1).